MEQKGAPSVHSAKKISLALQKQVLTGCGQTGETWFALVLKTNCIGQATAHAVNLTTTTH